MVKMLTDERRPVWCSWDGWCFGIACVEPHPVGQWHGELCQKCFGKGEHAPTESASSERSDESD